MRLLAVGAVRPVAPITTMGVGELGSGLRMLQSGKTTGKVVMKHNGSDLVKVRWRYVGGNHLQMCARTHADKSIRQATNTRAHISSLTSHATYVIAGGTGGLGRSMAKMMVQRGARTIVLLSRGGLVTSELQALMDDCSSHGARILVKSCDIGDPGSVRDVTEGITKSLPPIRGFVHAAMVLRVSRVPMEAFHLAQQLTND